MAKADINIPGGMRDFSPEEMAKRNYIFQTIENVFRRYGFEQIETPSMENLSVLTGKYGEEGDRLIYKILNSGDYLKDIEHLGDLEAKQLTPKISDKALRFDLTVPLARYVVMNRNEISFPFKRYQIQPVWRADRPQKGRFREFYQCDVDVIGSNSLLNEVELLQILSESFEEFKIQNSKLKINHRKILMGLAETIGAADKLTDLTVAVDKLDKIGADKFHEELYKRGLSEEAIIKLDSIIPMDDTEVDLATITEKLKDSESGNQGITEISGILQHCQNLGLSTVEFDVKLARGLDYYTGCIMEASVSDSDIGSIAGGGRYDDLTGVFGLPEVSGVGVSFGVERIYEILESKGLFPDSLQATAKLLFTNFGDETEGFVLESLQKLRAAGINSLLYSDSAKLQKQFKYADKKGIPYVIVAGPEEKESGKLTFKNMNDGSQENLTIEEIIKKLE